MLLSVIIEIAALAAQCEVNTSNILLIHDSWRYRRHDSVTRLATEKRFTVCEAANIFQCFQLTTVTLPNFAATARLPCPPNLQYQSFSPPLPSTSSLVLQGYPLLALGLSLPVWHGTFAYYSSTL